MYKHLSKEERYTIEKLIRCGKSNRETAEILGRSASKISREIKQDEGDWRYRHDKAHGLAELRQQWARQSRISELAWSQVFERYNEDHSPEIWRIS
ncbi:MAG: hypothetical protein A2Y14_02995 [Verrucomicrobia bacterium GWF2_51_19]|nr:MAG: hypothetical protein A2Y14_02995 [Verrucomicrobia bacterium GWF2_51_19]HCJ11578.1 hypothetical protein [Opitutae bacterium]